MVDLHCEHLINPIGLDTKTPRLSWKLDSKENGIEQEAYQIIVATDSHFTAESLIWESAKKTSDKNLIRYSGPELEPFTKYYWGVQLWDNHGENAVSEVATFETGMMDRTNWKGSWMTNTRNIDLKPAPYSRKKYRSSKKIISATAYIAVAGLYEFSINGTKVGDHRLDPMYTRFDRRILYVTYDITEFLNEGPNVIGVLLGNGWYNHQSTAVWYFDEAPWRARPKFCMDVRLTYEDGSIETIGSGNSWRTSLSPVIFNSIYTAEHYDARLEQAGWDLSGFNDDGWKEAMLTPAPSTNIVAQALQPIRNVEKIQPVSLNKLSGRNYIFDLGRNIAGVSQLTVSGEAGTTIKLIHGEMLDVTGRVDLSNIAEHFRPTDDSDPFQTDIFILSGKGEESFMPRFNYKGFQYVEIQSDKPIDMEQNSLAGYFMHSDVPPVGNIESSNPTIKKIWTSGNNSYLSNLFGYPTDCPQRDERRPLRARPRLPVPRRSR